MQITAFNQEKEIIEFIGDKTECALLQWIENMGCNYLEVSMFNPVTNHFIPIGYDKLA